MFAVNTMGSKEILFLIQLKIRILQIQLKTVKFFYKCFDLKNLFLKNKYNHDKKKGNQNNIIGQKKMKISLKATKLQGYNPINN